MVKFVLKSMAGLSGKLMYACVDRYIPGIFPDVLNVALSPIYIPKEESIMVSNITTRIPTFIRTYIHMYIHKYKHVYLHAYVNTHIHACVHACIHIHIHTYIYEKISEELYDKLKRNISFQSECYCYLGL